MAQPQLVIRSIRATTLAHHLAERERRTVTEVIERALEAYEASQTGREDASAFYSRISANFGTDVDLDALIRESRLPHRGMDL